MHDAVLRGFLPTGVNVTHYADDTLVIEREWGRTTRQAELDVACITESIRQLGLYVSSDSDSIV